MSFAVGSASIIIVLTLEHNRTKHPLSGTLLGVKGKENVTKNVPTFKSPTWKWETSSCLLWLATSKSRSIQKCKATTCTERRRAGILLNIPNDCQSTLLSIHTTGLVFIQTCCAFSCLCIRYAIPPSPNALLLPEPLALPTPYYMDNPYYFSTSHSNITSFLKTFSDHHSPRKTLHFPKIP